MHCLVATFCLLVRRGSVISPSIYILIISNHPLNLVQFTMHYTTTTATTAATAAAAAAATTATTTTTTHNCHW
jgi:hypothetical protein